MTATLVGDIGYRSGGSATQTDTGGEQSIVYLVQLGTGNETQAEIVAATGTIFYQPHPDDSDRLSQRATIRAHNNEPLLREVEVFFSTSGDQEEEEERNPLDRRIKIRWGSKNYQKFISRDRDGNPLVTTAGEFFEDVPPKDDARWVITFEKNEQFVPLWVKDYRNKLNNAPVTIDNLQFDAETLKFQNLQISDELTDNRIKYRQVHWELHYRDSWKHEITNKGYYERDPDFPDFMREIKIPFKDDDGNDLSRDNPKRRRPNKPYPIDANGAAIIDPTINNIVVREFDVYETADFSALPGVT